jgi:uncharacterized HAD superfamily protein
MKLGFDIDGVVANTPLAMVTYINEKFNLNLTEDVFKHHDVFSNTYVEDLEENEKIATAMLEEVILNADRMAAVEIYEDAAQAIRKFSRYHSIHFITARPESQHKVTIDWMRTNNIPFTTINSLGSDAPGGGKVGKGKTARSLNLDFFIDDSPSNLSDFYRYKKRWRKGIALLTKPWNENITIDEGMFLRFGGWNEVIRHLGIHKR